MKKIDTKDMILIVLSAWANVIATATLIHTVRQDKKKTAPRKRPSKHKRKR